MWKTTSKWLCVAVLCGSGTAWGENWPCWRGPRGDGSSSETNLPTTWNTKENIAWKTPLPGIAHSSPIVWEDRIFTNSCDTEKEERLLVCVDRRNGKILWQQVVMKSPLEGKHKLNSYASSTPATDGELVYTSFLDRNDMVVTAYDFGGKQKWLVRPGQFASKHGFCSSPVIYKDLLIVNGDHDGESYLVALNKNTGETKWKVARAQKTRSYSVPLLREVNGKMQMFLAGSHNVSGYNPDDGKMIWNVNTDHLDIEQYVASLVYSHGLIFVTAGFPDRHLLAIRPDGSGDVTKTHIQWQHAREGVSYVPSPVAEGDYFYVVSDNGIGSQFNAKTGQRSWLQRMGRHFSASLVNGGGLVYFLDDDGNTTVIKPSDDYQVVSKNTIDDAFYSSPAISQGQIFLRSETHLYAIGKSTKTASAK